MTAASRSLATALWGARFASGLLHPCYTTIWDTTQGTAGCRPGTCRHGHYTEAIRIGLIARETSPIMTCHDQEAWVKGSGSV